MQCAKAKALLDGRYHPTVNDIRELARPALRHRIAANYAAQANQVDNERLLEMLLETVPHDQVYERPSEEAKPIPAPSCRRWLNRHFHVTWTLIY